MATDGVILHSVMTTAVASFGKDGGRSAQEQFAKLIKGLTSNGS